MSIYTNSAAQAAEGADQYTAAVLELLGERDPLAVMAELPGWLHQTLAGVDGDVLGRPEAPGKWSIVQVAWHLADSEVINNYRLRAIVATPGIRITGYDQDAWADGLGYADADCEDALRLIDMLRPLTVAWAGGLTPDELERVGVHEERGAESARHLLRMLAGHDLVHRAQIERILRAVRSAGF